MVGESLILLLHKRKCKRSSTDVETADNEPFTVTLKTRQDFTGYELYIGKPDYYIASRYWSDMFSMATQLWALHMGLKHARNEQFELITLETDNHQVFYEVIRQDGRGD
ncbi:hypothetical protein POM88_049163 [Heracleum sosnowskyi]|uniref:Uncharacterized protein n=1 Tax=Heracleum sosnowskyi TaxID=360622 RepID=A0AAD8M1B0_9APIA|nr:hypothetical protein POM88_049163 [Heracleum sosnowskyi]